MRCVLTLAALTFLPGHVRAGEVEQGRGPASVRAAVIRVSAPAEWVGPLERALESALATHGSIIGPQQWRRQLTERADVAAKIAEARSRLEEAEEAALSMDRQHALEVAEHALDNLDSWGGSYVAPRLVARLQVAHGRALLLHPPDVDRARAAFCASVAVDPTFEPDADRLPPTAASLYDQARPCALSSAPTAEVVRALAAPSGNTPLVWVQDLPSPGGRVNVRIDAYGAKPLPARRTVRGQVAQTRAAEEIVELILPLLEKPSSAPKVTSTRLPTTVAVEERRAPGPQTSGPPWYRRWWVWALVGVAVVGAGVGLGVGLSESASKEPDFDFRFDLP